MNKIWILSKYDHTEYENSRLLESFKNKNLDAILLNPSQFDIIVNKDIKQGLRYNGEVIKLPSLVLVRIGSGATSFMLALIRQLEKAGVPCLNSADTIECVKDKLHTSQILSQHSIAIPNTMLVRFPVDAAIVNTEIEFPCVVKIITGSYGKGVHLCESQSDFRKLMEFIDSLDSKKTLVVQEYLGERPGEDLRVLVVGGKVIGAMKRTAKNGDFRANINAGGTGESYQLTEEIEYIARESAKVLNLDIAGIDLLFDSRGFRVCEANSNPGFSGFEKYCQIDVADVIADYIKFKIS
jgi:gamma-F420-2:alpha-L-glutamate ligase